MPTPLTPSSSQEIIAISPPPASKRRKIDIGATCLPKPAPAKLDRSLQEKVALRLKEQERKERTQAGKRLEGGSGAGGSAGGGGGGRRGREEYEEARGKEEMLRERERMEGVSRSRMTERMVCASSDRSLAVEKLSGMP
jgi:hypothetical protein